MEFWCSADRQRDVGLVDRSTWRHLLGDLWRRVAAAGLTRGPGGFGPREAALACETAACLRRLILLRREGRAAQGTALRVAAAALEIAAIASSVGPRGRGRLWRALEVGMRDHDRAVREGDGAYALRARDVAALGERIQQAVDERLVIAVGPVRAGGAVEGLLVELAILAVRAALNLSEFGVAAGPMARAGRLWREHIEALAMETDDALRRSAREDRRVAQAGLPWREALAVRAPAAAMAQVADVASDRTLRAEALIATRSAWMRSATCRLAILKDDSACWSAEHEWRMRGVMIDVALRRLDDAQLAAMPWRFDHRGAWERNQQLLLLASRAFLDCPSMGWDRREPRTLPLLAAGISRAWLAVAVIDSQLGDRAIGAKR